MACFFSDSVAILLCFYYYCYTLEFTTKAIVHLVGNEKILVIVECLEKFGCDVRVGLCAELHPLAEGHEHLDGIHYVGFLVEFLNNGREFGQSVAQSGYLVRVAGFVYLTDEGIDGKEELVDQLRSRHILGSPLLFPSLRVGPLGYCYP